MILRPINLGLLSLLAIAGCGVLPGLAAAAEPEMSPGVERVPFDPKVFRPDPAYTDKPYEPERQIEIYGGKRNVDEPRPIIELGRPLYREGPLPGGYNLAGRKNLVNPSLQVYGDWRTAIAYNDNGATETGQIATRLNLDVDLALTSTERIHALFRPLDQNGEFSRYEFFGNDRKQGKGILDGNVDTLFFEGDLGNIFAGLSDRYQSFDLPFAAGLMPLIFQNGVWADDAISGFAFAIPARHSSLLGISNMDISFFAGFDKVSTPAIKDDRNKFADHNVRVYGAALFIEANGGYWEAGLGRVDGEGSFSDLSYNSATVAFTRRYGGWLSNSLRGVWTFGQDRLRNQQQNADGFILLMENSLITAKPLTLVPYLNLFAGFDRPQSLIRDAGAGGILKNTGILFETDGLTNFPKLDDTGQNTYGGAIGLQYLFNLDQQLVFEAAALRPFEGDLEPGRPARAQQFGAGVRYQVPLTKSVIFRADAILAHREKDANLAGVRSEIRFKF
jgi:hypothetical protein